MASNAMIYMPPEVACVPQETLQAFLHAFSRGLLGELSISPAAVPDSRLGAAVLAAAARATTAPEAAAPLALDAAASAPAPMAASVPPSPARQLSGAGSIPGMPSSAAIELRLEWKHTCQHWGCLSEECLMCKNNALKVCDDAAAFDGQYWVRDDGKGGQVVRAKCGADVYVQAVDCASGMPAYLPDVRIKLYIVSGAPGDAPGLDEPLDALAFDDDGGPLFAVAGAAGEADGGVPLETVQDDWLGPVARIPELQFLNKNSKFKSGGRTFKAFKFLARAVRRDAATGALLSVAQVDSEPFKVTTKKGYDGCRKAEYLYAREIITDKTFANLGETTINNLKTTFEGVDTVEDLLALVNRAAREPKLEHALREVLNMGRDAGKWRNLTRMLHERVVWDDSVPRLWMMPNAARPLGLLFRAHKGQAEFTVPAGIVTAPAPPPGVPLLASPLTEELRLCCSRQIEQLTQMAAQSWRMPCHPGWQLAGDRTEWLETSPDALSAAFTEAAGSGDAPTMIMQSLLLGGPPLGLAAAGAAGAGAPPPPQLGLGPRPGTPMSVSGLTGGGGGDMSAFALAAAHTAQSAPPGRGPSPARSGDSGGAPARSGSGGGPFGAAAAAAGAARAAAAARAGSSAVITTALPGGGVHAASLPLPRGGGAGAAAALGGAGSSPAALPGGPPTGDALRAMPVWEKAAVLQQAIREGWPEAALQGVLACLSDDEITAIRAVHSAQLVAGGGGGQQQQQAAQQHQAAAAAAAAMEALMSDAGAAGGGGGGVGGFGGGLLTPIAGSLDVDAIIEASAIEAAAAAMSAGALASAAAAVGGGGGGGGGSGDGDDDDRVAFSIEELRDLKGHLECGGGGAGGGVDRSFDSLSLPSIHDQDGWNDLLRDLRRVSSLSNPSFNATDWIPDILARGSIDEEAAADGDAAADDAAAAPDADGPPRSSQRAKRERSSAYLARNHQAALAAAVAADDSFSGDALRAMLNKGDHTSSFGRHTPAMRIHSGTQDAATRSAGVAARVADPDAAPPCAK
ncbi:MAG: hypothetical protein J3K34DRAFT_518168 [Monoraphidium minutum]|nr:MAG: hypothetical protein J3K34DRAFT_518168 [Monoraphidium minutum]